LNKGRKKEKRRKTVSLNIGEVYNVVNTGHIIVKLSKYIRNLKKLLGSKAYIDGENIGFVSDIIGNVESPYIVIKPNDRTILNNAETGKRVSVILIEKPNASGGSRRLRKRLSGGASSGKKRPRK
jgi:rRNA processing protein Gar1